MLIFDQNLKKRAYHWHGYKWGPDKAHINSEDIGRILMVLERISEGYSCGNGDGGCSWEETEIADLLTMVYECGYQKACQNMKERLKGLISD